MVVHNIGQVVRGQLVGTLEEHLVVEDGGVDFHVAANHIVHVYVLAWFNLEAHHVLRAAVNESLHLVGGHHERIAHHVARMCVVLEILNLCALGLQLFGRIEGDIRLALFEELVYVFLINLAAFALAIRPFVAAVADTLVKLYAEPFEGFDDIVLGSLDEALRIGVFDAEDEFAAVLAGEEVVVKGGTHTADMQGPSGARGETHPDFAIVHCNNCNKRVVVFGAKLQNVKRWAKSPARFFRQYK